MEFETALGLDFYASGKIGRILVICLDDDAFSQATESVRLFNIVRRGLNPEQSARLIQGAMIAAALTRGQQTHPFLGREAELIELEGQVFNHNRVPSRALFVSGNAGAGRRTLARKFYQNHYPHVNQVLSGIRVEPYAGLDELYRSTLSTLRPSISAPEFRTRMHNIATSSQDQKARAIAQLLNSVLAANEALYLIDNGGLLTDEGSLTPELNNIVSHLEARPHPPAIIVAPRMIPRKLRRNEDDISYIAVRSLDSRASARVISKLLHDRDIRVGDNELDELVKLSDAHPFNFYRICDELSERGLSAFLADPSDFIAWKHRQSSEYVSGVTLNEAEVAILALFQTLPELDFESIVEAAELTADVASEALSRLSNLHIIEPRSDSFAVAPALRVAVERDRRITMSPLARKKAAGILAKSLALRIEEGSAPVSLVDTAVLASLEAEGAITQFAGAFLLPSHYVWVAKRFYDQRRWEESIRASREALKGASRLSLSGKVAACRFLCLSSARMGDETTFKFGIEELERTAGSDWAKSNIAFLRGFNERLKGNLPAAEQYFRRCYELSPGNISAAREIASICLAREQLDESERFAREAHSHARGNAYILDILLAVLIRKHGKESRGLSEINELFDALDVDDRESGRSFFTTRKAEFEYLWGDNKKALSLVEQAIRRTPRIFEPRRLYVRILLKSGNKTKAEEQLDVMRDIVNARDPNERRSNYRPYLETQAAYLVEVGRYDEAKAVFNDPAVFDSSERQQAVREIETDQAFRLRRR